MATVEQCLVEANGIAARMALYDARARHGLEDGDSARFRHWVGKAMAEQARLDASKARLLEARRIATLGVRGAVAGWQPTLMVVDDLQPAAPAARPLSELEQARMRALIGRSNLVVGGT